MSDAIERRLQIESERWAQLDSRQLSVLTAGEQTRLSWARAVESRADLPAAYQSLLDSVLKEEQTFPYAVLTPTYPGFLRRENEKLIFNLADRLWVIERDKSGLHSACFRVADIHYVEIGSILLDGWIKLSGLANGSLTTSRLRFNTVSDRLFTPFVQLLRPDISQLDEPAVETERSKFDYLMALNFKFMNYARRSLLPGETVLCPVLQPEIRARIISLFGHALYRTVAMAQLHILTDTEWIIIRDDEHSPIGFENTRYGGVWTYVLLTKIESVAIAPRTADLLTVSIRLPHDDHLTAVFAGSNRTEIDKFLDQLRRVAPHIRLT